MCASSNQQSTKRRGDLFQSSFHNRGGPANPIPPVQHPAYSHPSPTQQPPSLTSNNPSSSPPPPYTQHTATYLHPNTAYTNSVPPASVTTSPSSSSSSPTPHPQGPAGNLWHHHHHHHYHPHHLHHPRLDLDSDNGNYAVPPSHPRPLHATPEELPPHVRRLSFHFVVSCQTRGVFVCIFQHVVRLVRGSFI